MQTKEIHKTIDKSHKNEFQLPKFIGLKSNLSFSTLTLFFIFNECEVKFSRSSKIASSIKTVGCWDSGGTLKGDRQNIF